MCPRLQGRNITEAADDHICTNKLVRSDSVCVCVCVCVCVESGCMGGNVCEYMTVFA